MKKTVITLQALRFKLMYLNQTCISLKSIMQLARTVFFDSATFIVKKRIKNRLWPKSDFLWPKQNKMVRRTPLLGQGLSGPPGPKSPGAGGAPNTITVPNGARIIIGPIQGAGSGWTRGRTDTHKPPWAWDLGPGAGRELTEGPHGLLPRLRDPGPATPQG